MRANVRMDTDDIRCTGEAVMGWDYEKIEAAVSTLAEALGTICNVEIGSTAETEEVEPLDGFRHYKIVYGSRKIIITITPKED